VEESTSEGRKMRERCFLLRRWNIRQIILPYFLTVKKVRERWMGREVQKGGARQMRRKKGKGKGPILSERKMLYGRLCSEDWMVQAIFISRNLRD